MGVVNNPSQTPPLHAVWVELRGFSLPPSLGPHAYAKLITHHWVVYVPEQGLELIYLINFLQGRKT